MATAFGVRLLGTALVVISDSTDLRDKGPELAPSPVIAADSKMTTKAVPSDTAGKLSEVIFCPGGATEISRWWSEAQPPGQVEEDCLHPGRDAGPEFATGPIPVRRPFRARYAVALFPAATLRSAPPPANIPRASGAVGVCQQYQDSPHSIRSATKRRTELDH
jgi:hypothetical protein